MRLATIPGRCAAPPAPAIITLIPRSRAVLAYSTILSGVRCADTTSASHSTPNDSRTLTAADMVSQSLLLPIITPTFMLLLYPAMQLDSVFAEDASHFSHEFGFNVDSVFTVLLFENATEVVAFLEQVVVGVRDEGFD